MSNLVTPIRLLFVLAALAAVALPASGCGTSSADPNRGRILFIQKCGVCHVMAQAGTTAQVGPNLDDAFAAARAAGEGGDTVEGVVKAQVESPRPSNSDPAVSMPADVVTGQDLEDVAAYVGLYAGVPGAAAPKVPGGPGAQVFANNGCGGCHTLKAAGTSGVTGPSLDKLKEAALAWQLTRTFVTSVIIGAKTRDQLVDNLAAVDAKIAPEHLKLLDEASALPPEYPGWMVEWQNRDPRGWRPMS